MSTFRSRCSLLVGASWCCRASPGGKAESQFKASRSSGCPQWFGSVRWRLLRRGRRWLCGAAAINLDVNDLNWTKRTVIAGIGGHMRNLLDQSHSRLVALPEQSVLSVQMRRGNFCNEKLRAIRIRAGIRIGETTRPVEWQIRRNLILELISRIARPVSLRVAALNHEAGNHTMENGSIVKRYTMFCSAADRILPIFRSSRQANKVLHTNWSFIRK